MLSGKILLMLSGLRVALQRQPAQVRHQVRPVRPKVQQRHQVPARNQRPPAAHQPRVPPAVHRVHRARLRVQPAHSQPLRAAPARKVQQVRNQQQVAQRQLKVVQVRNLLQRVLLFHQHQLKVVQALLIVPRQHNQAPAVLLRPKAQQVVVLHLQVQQVAQRPAPKAVRLHKVVPVPQQAPFQVVVLHHQHNPVPVLNLLRQAALFHLHLPKAQQPKVAQLHQLFQVRVLKVLQHQVAVVLHQHKAVRLLHRVLQALKAVQVVARHSQRHLQLFLGKRQRLHLHLRHPQLRLKALRLHRQALLVQPAHNLRLHIVQQVLKVLLLHKAQQRQVRKVAQVVRFQVQALNQQQVAQHLRLLQ